MGRQGGESRCAAAAHWILTPSNLQPRTAQATFPRSHSVPELAPTDPQKGIFRYNYNTDVVIIRRK